MMKTHINTMIQKEIKYNMNRVISITWTDGHSEKFEIGDMKMTDSIFMAELTNGEECIIPWAQVRIIQFEKHENKEK